MAMKILLILAVSLALQAPASAAFRFGLGKSAAARASNVMEEAIPAFPVMILPISPLESVTTGQVIWPYGVQGGGHPNGHPGLDFQTVLGASIYATATAKVLRIENDFTDGFSNKLLMLETRGYQIVYTGNLLNMTIAPGDIVRKGQKIAELGQFSPTQPYCFLHWGINVNSQQSNVCPYDTLNPESKRQLDALFALTTYSEQSRFPLLCNPCPPGGCR